MIVVLDIGNTSTKYGVFDDTRLVSVERIEGGAPGENLFPVAAIASASEVIAISSSPKNSAGLAAKLGRPVRLLGDDVRLRVRTTYSRPEDLGIDRIAAVWGARAMTGMSALVVADVGTAITVDALDSSGRLIAVAIAPGLDASRDGLIRAAPHLPAPSLRPGKAACPAGGTADSLRAGFVLGFAGLVDRLIAEAERAVGSVVPAVLTGGGAEVLAPHLATPHIVLPHAVLRGVVELHRALPVPV